MMLNETDIAFNSLPKEDNHFGTNVYLTTRETCLVNECGDVIVLSKCRIYVRHKPFWEREVLNLNSELPGYITTSDDDEYNLIGIDVEQPDRLFVLLDGESFEGHLRFVSGGHCYEYLTPAEYEKYKQSSSVDAGEWMELMK